MFFLGKMKLYALGAVGLLAALGVFALKMFNAGVRKKEREELEDYKDTRERMDDVETVDNPDDARDWLRDRGER